jgi:predicted phosphodiesterase
VRYLILSDIHSNWEALEAVLEDALGAYDEILCCGDLVGYGADPNRVVEWTRRNVRVVVRGNHDKAAVGLEDLEWFNPVARSAALWTEQNLTAENHSYLRSLPKGPLLVGDLELVHGTPLDEDDYLMSALAAAELAGYLEKSVCFFGHTHVQGSYHINRGTVEWIEKPEAEAPRQAFELNEGAYLINPGSVGQPRDGDARAAYMICAAGERWLEYRRVAYPVEIAQAKILRAGLPGVLAERLAWGS